MTCTETRERLRSLHEGRLSDSEKAAASDHLASCAECRRIDAEERAVTSLLRERLPKHPAPEALKQRLAASLAEKREAPARPKPAAPRARPRFVAALAAAAVLAAASVLVVTGSPWTSSRDAVVEEAMNDHLRVLYAEHPIEIESGGIHQVKPWFSGRVDFAPVVAFSGDDEFPLLGGAVSYFVDRKAATFFFKRRLHNISLFVMRASGLSWPAHPVVHMGRVSATVTSRQGFHVVLFRDGDLGYALVSDVDPAELLRLGAKIVGPG